MPHDVVPPCAYWRAMLLNPQPLSLEALSPVNIDVFPKEDLPPIRHVDRRLHVHHLLLLGRRQLRGLPWHNVPYLLDWDRANKDVLLPETITITPLIRSLLLINDAVRTACRMPTLANWKAALHIALTPPAEEMPVPAIWVVSTACGDAEPGGVVECIVERTHQRLYAELQRVVALDFRSALFTATVLGQAEGTHTNQIYYATAN